jgi:hypothetical protein
LNGSGIGAFSGTGGFSDQPKNSTFELNPVPVNFNFSCIHALKNTCKISWHCKGIEAITKLQLPVLVNADILRAYRGDEMVSVDPLGGERLDTHRPTCRKRDFPGFKGLPLR